MTCHASYVSLSGKNQKRIASSHARLTNETTRQLRQQKSVPHFLRRSAFDCYMQPHLRRRKGSTIVRIKEYRRAKAFMQLEVSDTVKTAAQMWTRTTHTLTQIPSKIQRERNAEGTTCPTGTIKAASNRLTRVRGCTCLLSTKHNAYWAILTKGYQIANLPKTVSASVNTLLGCNLAKSYHCTDTSLEALFIAN